MFLSTKTYGPELGLSAVFRQWRADSHCNQLHGYALGFKLTFAALELDDRGWVMDFGGLGPVKEFLRETFDHKVMMAADDPHSDVYSDMVLAKIATVVVLKEGVGCEKFAQMVHYWTAGWLRSEEIWPRVQIINVECFEHGANSAQSQVVFDTVAAAKGQETSQAAAPKAEYKTW